MAIRRRRKTLTNLLSTMERRVTSVELRPINLLTAAQVAGAVGGDEELDGGPDSVVSLNAPNQYKPITDGYYYGSNIAGKPRVELYFNGDPGLAKDKTIRISGINTLFKNSNETGPIDFDLSKDYKVVEVDKPPYNTGRDTYNGKRDTPEETVDSTATFNPSTGNEFGSKRKLAVKARISTVQATTNIATIVFSEPHYFKENQIIYVNLPDTPYFGIDGLFRIDEVVNNTTIKYAFDASLPEPINLANITEERYVHAVAQSAIRDGATWFDTSQNPDVAYVWDDYRWVLFGSSTVADDDMPPQPITNLTATDKNDTPPGSGEPRMEVTLEWDAPTKNQDGTPLVDLYGYRVEYRQRGDGPWRPGGIVTETTWTQGGFLPATIAYFKVWAVDSGNNESTAVTLNYTTGQPVAVVEKPKAPAVTSYLGTIKISYDDLTAFGTAQSPTASEIEVYFSQQSGFTPGPSNFYGKFIANEGSYIIIPGTELVDGVDYYVKIIVRDIYGNITAPSEQVAIRAKLKNIVTFDMIDVGTLTGQVIIGLDIRTSSNPSRTGGIVLNRDGMVAYDRSGTPTFRLTAADGSVSIGSYLGRSEAQSSFLTIAAADLKYATIANASSIALIAGDAEDVALAAQQGLNAARKDLDEITELAPGSIRVIKRNKAIGAINGSTTEVTEINGGVIKTGTLSASKITTGTLDASQVTVTNINATNIDAGILSSRIVRTNVPGNGKRVSMASNPDNYIEFYNSSALQGVITTTDFGEFIMQRNTGSASGRVRLTASYAELAAGFNSINVCGVNRAYVIANSSSQVLIGSDSAITGNGVFLNFPAFNFTGANRPLTIDSNNKINLGTSDGRLKNIVSEKPLGLSFISSLNPVSFTWKPETKIASPNIKEYGLIAQEVENALLSEGVDLLTQNITYRYGDDSYLEAADTTEDSSPIRIINYSALIPVLIKSTQELLDKIKLLEEEVTKLKEDK